MFLIDILKKRKNLKVFIVYIKNFKKQISFLNQF